MNNKPAYKDFKRHNIYSNQPKCGYIMGDRGLIVIIQFVLAFFPLIMIKANPYFPLHLYWWLFLAGFVVIPLLLYIFCLRLFIYCFGWFDIIKTNQYAETAAINQKPDSRCREKRKSRLIFSSLIVSLVLFMSLFWHFSCTLSYQRLYNDQKESLIQLASITQKYSQLHINDLESDLDDIAVDVYKNDTRITLSPEDIDAFRTICANFNGYYVDRITGDQTSLTIWLDNGFGFHQLVWILHSMDEQAVLSSQHNDIISSLFNYDIRAIQLDRHWWYIW